RQRHADAGARDCRVGRVFDRWRRRYASRGRKVQSGKGYFIHLHRRWRIPRIPRRQGIAGSRGIEGARKLNTAKRLVLFDLDGTLIDSQAGIFASLHHAFAQIGAALPSPEVLRSWIGPPFHQTFPSALGNDAARVESAIAHYREHYV